MSDEYTTDEKIIDHFRAMVKFPVWSILPYIEGYEGEEEFDFAVDALAAMVERRFEVVWVNPTHNPPLHMMFVDDTGLAKANYKAVKFMQEICAERGWDFAGFTMKSIEEYLFCDDPRAGES